MPLLQEEVDRFHKFATERVSLAEIESLQELFDQWSAKHPGDAELQASIASLNRGLDDASAGRVRTADEVIQELRDEMPDAL